MAAVNPFSYTAYGLHVQSPIALPFVPCSAGTPDVTIRFGPTPAALPTPMRTKERRGRRWESAPGAFLFDVTGMARYLVTGGRDVLIESRGGSDSEIVRLFVGPVFAALLQQCGVMTFHASAIETRAGAVLFAGRSGVGKSSLLAALVQRGYAILADDVTGVALDAAGRPVALAAFPVMRLWADTARVLYQGAWMGGRVHEAVEKYSVPAERFREAPLAVRAVYVLDSHNRDGIEVEPLRPSRGFRHLMESAYRRAFLDGFGQRPLHVRTVVAMAKQVSVVRMVRPAHPFLLGALANRIEKLLGQEPAPKKDGSRHTSGWTVRMKRGR